MATSTCVHRDLILTMILLSAVKATSATVLTARVIILNGECACSPLRSWIALLILHYVRYNIG